jgi:5-methylcytosine-specific restriction endonuclease McrA
MARLRSLGQRVDTLTPKLRRLELNYDEVRRGTSARSWYNSLRWRGKPNGLRWQCLTRDLFTCQWPGCGRIEGDSAQLVADHIVPHRGNPRLFFDLHNLQTLCKTCHDTHKQRIEVSEGRGG